MEKCVKTKVAKPFGFFSPFWNLV